jgi:hypothetical protein
MQYVITLADEMFVTFYRQMNIKVSLWSAEGTGVAFSGKSDLRAAVNARRNGHLDLALLLFSTRSFALLAGVSDNGALSVALTAGGHVHEVSENAVL